MGQFTSGPLVSCDFLSRCKNCGGLTDSPIHTGTEYGEVCHFVSDDETLVRLKRDVVYIDDDDNEHIAPAGMISDGTSNPKFTWPFLGHPLKTIRFKPSLIHDSKYQCAPPWEASIWKAMHSELRLDADSVYLNAMADENDEQRHTVFRWVRIGGWLAWYRHAKRNAEGIPNG